MSNADHETPPEPSSPETRFARFRRWAWRRKIIVRTVLGTLLAYVVLFTFVWSVLVELVLAGAYFTVHLGVADEDLPAFRPYIWEQSAFRAVCNAANWVADITQPLVSDEVMIAYWQQHHLEWEAALGEKEKLQKKLVTAWSADDVSRFESYLKSIGLAELNYDGSLSPERFAILIPIETLGVTHRSRPCAGRGGSSKSYKFYPSQAPVIVGDQVLTASSLEFARTYHHEPSGNLLVESNNHTHYTYSMKRLTDNWFVMRWY
jgi:hypothetical protein